MEITRKFPRPRPAEALRTSRGLAEADVLGLRAGLDAAERHPGRPVAGTDVELDLSAAQRAHAVALTGVQEASTAAELSAAIAVLADGRRRLAYAGARLDGKPRPAGSMPCPFDPSHGPSARTAMWTSGRHGTHLTPACALDAARLEFRQRPLVRTVEVDGRTVPYWDGGEEVAAYLEGYFAGDLLPGWLHPASTRTDKGTSPTSAYGTIDTLGIPSSEFTHGGSVPSWRKSR